MTSPDAADICRQLLFIVREEQALVDLDPYAPDKGPNHERHRALLAEYAALAAALTKSAPPTTPDGTKALAQLALTYASRTFDGSLKRPKDFARWLTLFALTSAAGNPQAIPLPEYLPNYWPLKQ